LVDQSGSLQDAIAAAARRAGLGEQYQVRYVEERLSGFENWLVSATGMAMLSLDLEIPPHSAIGAHLSGADPLATQVIMDSPLAQNIWRDLSGLLKVEQPSMLAHCFCVSP